jgi:hypothetical protein
MVGRFVLREAFGHAVVTERGLVSRGEILIRLAAGVVPGLAVSLYGYFIGFAAVALGALIVTTGYVVGQVRVIRRDRQHHMSPDRSELC